MHILFTIADYFEGFLRYAFFILLVVGGIKLMGLAKVEERYAGFKLAGMGMMLWAMTSLMGDMAFAVGVLAGIPESLISGLVYTLYAILRQLVSGFIDIGAGAMVMMGISKVVATFKPPS